MANSCSAHHSFKVLDVLLDDGKAVLSQPDYRGSLGSLILRYLDIAMRETGGDLGNVTRKISAGVASEALDMSLLEEVLLEVRAVGELPSVRQGGIPIRPGAKREEPQIRRDSSLNILIVEDVPVVRMLLDEYLSPYGKRDLSVDGRHGLLFFLLALENRSPYDLVCLDIMMPKMDGHQLLTLLRRCELDFNIPVTRSSKVIMTTALSDSKSIFSSFKEGSEGYLVKPVVLEELLTLMLELGLVTDEKLREGQGKFVRGGNLL